MRLRAAMKVRCWTRGAASWRASGERIDLEKLREAIVEDVERVMMKN
jgi:hypothetical protein